MGGGRLEKGGAPPPTPVVSHRRLALQTRLFWTKPLVISWARPERPRASKASSRAFQRDLSIRGQYMPKIHPADHLIQEHLETGSGTQKLRQHLQECAQCQQRAKVLRRSSSLSWTPSLDNVLRMPESKPDYSRVLGMSVQEMLSRKATLDRERSEAASLFSGLMSCAPEKRQLLLRNSSRFQTWGLLVKLLEQSRDDIQDVPQTECLAELARTLANSLDPFRYGASLIEDMRARAWCYTGNARRLRSDLLGAEEALQNASSCLRLGTSDPVERARLLDFKASLLRDQRRFSEAASFLRRSFEIFTETGERHRAARALVNLSTVHEHAGAPEQAITTLHCAGDLIDRALEPRLAFFVQHNIIWNLIEAGRVLEAQRNLKRTRALYQQFSDPFIDARRHWAEGKLARALGRREDAEALLLLARRQFIAERRLYPTAILSFDLTSLYLDQGRTTEAADLAQEILPFFEERAIHREATMAARLLQAAREGRLSTPSKI